MTTRIYLEQGSADWLAHRQLYRNASETPAVMGASPWMTPYQLWELRTGRRQQEVTYPMERGLRLEQPARVGVWHRAINGTLRKRLTPHRPLPLPLVRQGRLDRPPRPGCTGEIRRS